MAKVFIGIRLQRLREERGLTQTALAKALGISPSYLNQIEHNQRPLTVPVLLRINAHFGVDVQVFSDDEQASLVGDLRDTLVHLLPSPAALAEVRAIAGNMPEIGRAVVQLHRDYLAARQQADLLIARFGDAELDAALAEPEAGDQVRDYFNRRQNHVQELDEAAEALAHEAALEPNSLPTQLRLRLRERHRMEVEIARGDDPLAGKRRLDPDRRRLLLPEHLSPGRQAFQMAAELALLEFGDNIDALIHAAGFHDEERRRLARIGLANYFAGALVMPYQRFMQSAETCGYDIELLGQRFGVGFEAVCHRLSTLQRPGAPGLPFFFVRVDRAGNVSKRHSASDFHFSRVGGSCPLWIVYEAFNQPGKVLTQIAEMPDGGRYFWLARQVSSGPLGYGSPRKTFAVSLGCDLRHAHRLVYSRGLDLSADGRATPIGPGCRVCERHDCAQRAFPALPSRSG